jgi:hypothetical protein
MDRAAGAVRFSLGTWTTEKIDAATRLLFAVLRNQKEFQQDKWKRLLDAPGPDF